MKVFFISLLCFSSFSNEYKLDSSSKCFGYDKVPISTQDGSCVGMVVSSDEGLRKPRKVIQIKPNHFLVTDMVNWSEGRGILWDIKLINSKPVLTKLFTNLDRPHGLRKGPDGLIYVGEASQLFRFNIENPNETKEIVISDIPSKGKHPLSEFIFTSDSRIILNIGAPTDQCLKEGRKATYPCKQAESEALLREYTLNDDGSYSFNSNLAYGLRNSMGLVELDSGEIIQFNNGMDFKQEETPLEEINLISPGKNYGWPYCYEDGKLNKSYKRSFFNRRIPKIDCSIYSSPIGHLPAHSAPLDAKLYNGEMFPEFKGKILVSLHGYRKSGQRIIALNVKEESADDFEEVVFNWQAKSGIRPKGAPVGLEIGQDGEVYFLDDKNKTLMVMAKGNAHRSNEDQIVEEIEFDLNVETFTNIQKTVLNKHCIQCHSSFHGKAKDVASELVKSGLVLTGNALESELYKRVTGTSQNMMMPPSGISISEFDKELIKNWIESISTRE